MIPILWRYEISRYARTLLLSIGTFVSILLISRFKEMARFAALSGSWLKTGLFAVYQIPFILPMAIPLSALIASLLLLQKFSRDHEITALRASGLSLKNLLAPLLFISFLLGVLNFSITAELAPFCRRQTKELLYRETSTNPLLLLQRQGLIKLKNAYLRMDVEKEGKSVRDFILIARNASTGRLGLVSAEKLKSKREAFLGENVAIISHLPAKDPDSFDSLLIENQGFLSTDADLLSTSLKKNRPKIEVVSLSFRMLLQRKNEPGREGIAAFIEMFRRLSLALAVPGFTLLGFTFGIEPGRNPKRQSLLYVLFLTLAVLASYFFGKGLKVKPFLGILILSFPHLLLWLCCSYRLHRVARGQTT